MRFVAAFACALLTICLGIAPGHAERRVALVIGNSSYQGTAPLPNPRNDAADMAAALQAVGFETIVATDLDKRGMDDAFRRFARLARDADAALFFYAGHGMQFAGTNYLMPVDAKLQDEADVPYELAKVDDVIADLSRARNIRIVILDACRDNPLAERLRMGLPAARSAAVSRGLARIERSQGLITAFATQPGQVAADGFGTRNSPFTTALLKHLATPGIEAGTLFRRVAQDVNLSTAGKQTPELSVSMLGEFYFAGPGPGSAPAAAPAPSNEAERAWAAVRETSSVTLLEEFIRRFGDSFYAALARARLDELKRVAAVVPPVVPSVPAGPCGAAPLTVSWSTRAAQPLSTTEECALQPKDAFKECDRCPEMAVVPAGTFTMGSPASEVGRYDHEGPQHPVTIGKPFAVGKFQVTFDQFAAFVAETVYDAGSKCYAFEAGSKLGQKQGRSWRNPGFAQNGSHPAVCLNWNDANAYVAWLAKKTGKSYRLLTEAQWEYAARAGTTTRYSFGDDEKDFCRYGNGADQTAKSKITGTQNWTFLPCSDGYAYTAPVGSFSPNGNGLYDMHGNALQWLEDCWHDNYTGASTDGSAWVSGDCSRRVLRGGSWSNNPGDLRAANRGNYTTVTRIDGWGFRLGRTL
jgi:formylglycine-generating enzyme required for sulfatase activity